MYDNNDNFTSDLVNSYAWDTTLVFIQKCSDNSAYSQQTSSNIGTVVEKGTVGTDTEDVKCNIYDMASNCVEWSTETAKNDDNPCVNRGGYCYDDDDLADARRRDFVTNNYDNYSFRPILYL